MMEGLSELSEDNLWCEIEKYQATKDLLRERQERKTEVKNKEKLREGFKFQTAINQFRNKNIPKTIEVPPA